MSKDLSASNAVRKFVPLILVLALILGWSAAAHAQTSTEAQYASPTATASGNPAAAGNAAKAGEAKAGVAKASGSGKAKAKVLPSTGGSPLFAIALGALTLGVTGLLVIRQAGRR